MTAPWGNLGKPGHVNRGDEWEALLDYATTLVGAWTSYTPTWTASAGTPAIGNGTLTGKYLKVGRTLDITGVLTAGSTTTYGTAGAHWFFSLPTGMTASGRFTGSGYLLNSGVSEFAILSGIDPSTPTVIAMFRADSAADGRVTNTGPFTFGTADILFWQIRCETTS